MPGRFEVDAQNPSPCSYLLHVDADDEALIQFPGPNPSLGSAVTSPPIDPTQHISSQFYTFTAASHALMLRCVLAGRPAAAEEVRAATSPSVLASWRAVWKDRNEDTAYLTAWKCIQDKLAASADGRTPTRTVGCWVYYTTWIRMQNGRRCYGRLMG